MHHSTLKKIEIYCHEVPLKTPFTIALETIKAAKNIIVKIIAEDGQYGLGECSPYQTISGETQASAYAVAKVIAPVLLGRNVFDIAGHIQAMDQAIKGNSCIKSAFDIALYDLAAKKLGLPLYAFLGGNNDRTLHTDMTIGIDTPEKMAKAAQNFLKGKFPALKIKLGTTFEADLARIKAIRTIVGPDFPLRIDANQGWDVYTAVKTLKALEAENIAYCEAPVPSWNTNGMAQVRRQTTIPIMADESLFDHHDALQLIQAQACDFFNIKLAKSGGIYRALQIIAVAEAAGIPSQVGCFSETKIALAALAHLALARKNIRYFDMDAPLMLAEDPVVGGIEYLEAGSVEVLPGTGHGADLKEGYLEGLEGWKQNHPN